MERNVHGALSAYMQIYEKETKQTTMDNFWKVRHLL
jgi:hypothetical protein